MTGVLPYGDRAILINFEQRISRDINRRVSAYSHILNDLAGVVSVIPAYASLTVVFEPDVITSAELTEIVWKISLEEYAPDEVTARRIEIPVCYEGEYAPDLDSLAVEIGKAPEEIIRAHVETEFYVYMIGFMPGFGYLGDMPEEFKCFRKPVPRTQVRAGSVGLAGLQTAVYPFDSPGGWQLIGCTPISMFDPSRSDPGVLQGGDTVSFFRISMSEFEEMTAQS